MVGGTENLLYLRQLLQATRNSYKACGYQQLTVDGTVASLTIPTGAVYALMSLESSATGVAIRFLELGTKTPPTTTTGLLVSTRPMIQPIPPRPLLPSRCRCLLSI